MPSKTSVLIALRNRRLELEKLGKAERLDEVNDIIAMLESWPDDRTIYRTADDGSELKLIDGVMMSASMRCGTCRTIWNPAVEKHYCPGVVKPIGLAGIPASDEPRTVQRNLRKPDYSG